MTPFDRWYVDLSLVAFLTGLAVFTVTAERTGILRVAAVVPLVTVLPGYALLAFLYPAAGNHAVRTFDETRQRLQNPRPTKEGLDTLERFVFAVITTLVVVPAVALAANFTSWGITLRPLLFGIAGVTLLFTFGGLIRRLRLPAERRYTPQLSQVLANLTYSKDTSSFGPDDSRVRLFNIALGVSVVLLLSSIGYAAVNPPEEDGFTEMYVDTENVSGDTQSMYPSQFDAGETRTLTAIVTNEEHEQVSYEVVATLQRVNDTRDGPTVVEEDQIASRTATVEHNQTRTLDFEVTPSMRGSDLRLVLYLYRGEAPDDPTTDTAYRTLRLPIDVAEDRTAEAQSVTGQQSGDDDMTNDVLPLGTARTAARGD